MRASDSLVVPILVVIAGLCLPAAGCKKAGPSSPDAPAMAETDASDDSTQVGDPLAELAALEDRMRSLGLPVAAGESSAPAGGAEAELGAGADRARNGGDGEAPGAEAAEAQEPDDPDHQRDQPAPTAAREAPSEQVRDASDDRQRCTNLCDLSEAICQLEVRICGLMEIHDGEPIYANACSRAIDDCDVAGDACDHCAS